MRYNITIWSINAHRNKIQTINGKLNTYTENDLIVTDFQKWYKMHFGDSNGSKSTNNLTKLSKLQKN